MLRDPRPDRVPDYLVERLAAGDLPPAEAAALRARLAAEPGGEERLRALAEDGAATLARHPPRVVAAQVHLRADRIPPRRPLALALAPWAAGLGVLAIALPLALRAPPAGERLKGDGPALVLHRRLPTGDAEVLSSGAAVRGGDLVQVGYVAAGAARGAILSVDGAGGVTRHWPLDGAEAAPLTGGGEVLLPASFRLDDAPGYERFLLVTSGRPFALAPVLAAARALAARPDAAHAPLALDGELSQVSVLLRKEPRP